MMDNASALPTCPQRQQQEKTAFRKWPKITHTTSRRGKKLGAQPIHLEGDQNVRKLLDELGKFRLYPQVPDHLLGISDDKTASIRKTVQDAQAAINELTKLAAEVLVKIGRSEDDVSRSLENLFKSSVKPTCEQLKRARARKELGNPPGTTSDPLGDQISWEQFVEHCFDRKLKKVWIVSNDADYRTMSIDGSYILNPPLWHELRQAGVQDIRVCRDLLGASKDFGLHAGVTAKALPNEEEEKIIRQQFDAASTRFAHPQNIVLLPGSFHAGAPIFGSQSFTIFDAATGKEYK